MSKDKKILVEDTPWSEIGDRSSLSLNREAGASSSKPSKEAQDRLVKEINERHYAIEYCKFEEVRQSAEFQQGMKSMGLDPATYPNPHAEAAGGLPPVPLAWMEERRKKNRELL